MNRVRLGAVILLALVLLSCGSALTVHVQTEKLLERLDALEEIVDTGELDAAAEPFAAFEVQWERTETLLNLIVWRDRMTQIDATISHLDPMRTEDCDELKSELSEVRMWIERLRDCEMPSWENIL